jgi:hypothetical protein
MNIQTNTRPWHHRFRAWLAGLISPYHREHAGSTLNKWQTAAPYRHWSCFNIRPWHQPSMYVCELVWTIGRPVEVISFKSTTPQAARAAAAAWLESRKLVAR